MTLTPHIRIVFTGERSRADMVATLTSLGVLEITDDPTANAVAALYAGDTERIAALYGVARVDVLDAQTDQR